jgi:bifunctional non-homologous end joining protein LigD
VATKKTKTGKLNFTHTDKLYFPSGYTKGEMIQYYLEIAPYMLPHLKDRPVTLIRFPEGVGGESFYEKNAPAHAPDWIKTFPVPRGHETGNINYILINDAETLAWCANLGAIEIHPFLHRSPKIERPTHVAFDLDPGEGTDVITCAEVAFLLKELFEGLGLQSFPKVSGSKGIQIYVPLNTAVTYEATTPFARTVAELMERRFPELVVSNMSKALRKNKILIDWSQNNQSKTTVCVYSLRAKRDEPFVSTPVSWEELSKARKKKKPQDLFFSPNDVLARVEKYGDLFAPVLKLKQKLPKEFLALQETEKTNGEVAAGAQPLRTRTRKTSAKKSESAPAEEKANRSARSNLKAYEKKRDFRITREPGPDTRSARGKENAAEKKKEKQLHFVIQKHAATNLHYDFRLELEGTLKSWAVPKGLPYETGVRRAAFQVEDHPLSYMDFEGTIPKGQYGGGTVMVWDIGTYELLGGNWHTGDMKVWLHGKKLDGEWHIFRIKTEDEKPVWLVVKAKPGMKPLSAKQDDSSALTKRGMAKIASDNDAQWDSSH